MRDWAQVRAVVAREVGVGLGGRGEGSKRRRLPRSKVWGMGGFMVVVGLVTFAVEVECGCGGLSITVSVSIVWWYVVVGTYFELYIFQII